MKIARNQTKLRENIPNCAKRRNSNRIKVYDWNQLVFQMWSLMWNHWRNLSSLKTWRNYWSNLSFLKMCPVGSGSYSMIWPFIVKWNLLSRTMLRRIIKKNLSSITRSRDIYCDISQLTWIPFCRLYWMHFKAILNTTLS